MPERRRITEEDVRRTEQRIAVSVARLEQAVERAPARVIGSLGEKARRHPLETMAALAGGAFIVYGLIRLLSGGPCRKERVEKGSTAGSLLSMVLPLAAPYLLRLIGEFLKIGGETGKKDRFL